MNAPIIVETLLTLLPYAVGIVAWFYKDKILHLLNVELKKTSIDHSKKELDSIHIENSSNLVQVYRTTMDDLNKRNEATIKSIKTQYELDLKEMQLRYQEEREKDRVEDKARLLELEALRTEVKKLTDEVRKLTNQLKFYREHTDIELPEDLQ